MTAGAWNYFLETPPSFQDHTPLDIPLNSPLQFPVDQPTDDPSGASTGAGLILPEEIGEVQLDENEMECRVLLIKGLPPYFEEASIPKLFPPEIVNRFEKDETGAVTIEFYDLRNAMNYRGRLNGATFDGNPLTVRYGSPRKKTPEGKPANNGTIVLFHLSPAISSGSLGDEFRVFGEIRQIRKTPHKPHQRFIEFWDTRSAAEALAKMNGKIMGQSRIAIEFSVPGGMRRQALQ